MVKGSNGITRAGKPALQARSAETLERILLATEDLLADHEFDEISIAQIASRAGCAVGTVYGRVTNKEHLLYCLNERYMTRAAERAAEAFGVLGDADLVERVESLCELMVSLVHEHRGVIRAVMNHLYTSPSQAANEILGPMRRDATSMFRAGATILAEGMPGGANTQNQASCEFALLAAQDVTQGRIVFGNRSGLALKYSLKELKRRTAELILRYLSVYPQAPAPE